MVVTKDCRNKRGMRFSLNTTQPPPNTGRMRGVLFRKIEFLSTGDYLWECCLVFGKNPWASYFCKTTRDFLGREVPNPQFFWFIGNKLPTAYSRSILPLQGLGPRLRLKMKPARRNPNYSLNVYNSHKWTTEGSKEPERKESPHKSPEMVEKRWSRSGQSYYNSTVPSVVLTMLYWNRESSFIDGDSLWKDCTCLVYFWFLSVNVEHIVGAR